MIRSFKAALERAELPSIRFHDLRHTADIPMLKAGVPPKVASERLGHARVEITLDLYSHASAELDAEATERTEVMISPAGYGRDCHTYCYTGLQKLYRRASHYQT